MGVFSSAELNTVLISSLIGIIIAAGGTVVAWLQRQTKRFNTIVEENRAILDKNTAMVEDVRKQTDGMNIKLQKIAAAASFTKGRIVGREEGESNDPYEDLYKLEEEIGQILEIDPKKPKPKP